MAYDEGLAHRIREILADEPSVEEKKMFGGLAFMVNGNMCVGVNKDHLMGRVGTDGHDEAVALPHARIMDFTGRPMRGWIIVDSAGLDSDEVLGEWVQRCMDFVLTLPPK